ncbi:MAG: hypothetical protein IH872_04220 [Chloroflexi bacterium]|nr:hypothetical protein [Chloroflexota bacterium]
MSQSKEPYEEKISASFSAKLSSLRPEQKLVAILVLHSKSSGGDPGGKRSRARRLRSIDAVRNSAEEAFHDIDQVLVRSGGRRLTSHPDALGTVAVEITPTGLRDLALLDQVTAILEDQPLSSL